MLETPVVFMIFRRPELTRRVFERIARAQPRQLFIIADGPRNTAEMEYCQATRTVVEQIDWDCDVRRNYADENMGLRARFASGLNWVFEQVETAIILEDDCIPDASFFEFCETLLNKYSNNPNVMHISGANFGYTRPANVDDSYYFTIHAHVWGWATWRRAWAHYDLDMKVWENPAVRRRVLRKHPWWIRHYWSNVLSAVHSRKINTWDYQWLFSCLAHDGLCIMPFENLISNEGTTPDSVHVFTSDSPYIGRPLSPVAFPLKHPGNLVADQAAIWQSSVMQWKQSSLVARIWKRIRRLLKS